MYDDEFHLRPDWEPAAMAKDPQKMAHLIYLDLKKCVHGGIVPPEEAVSQMVATVKQLLYREYDWEVPQLETLQNEFDKLNQYYPKQVQSDGYGMDHMLPPNHIVLIPQTMMTQPPASTAQHQKTGHVTKSQKFMAVVYVIGVVLWKVIVLWLAIIGLLTLLG